MNLVTSHEGVTNTSLSEEQVGEEVDTLRVRMADELDKASLFRRPYLGFTQVISSINTVKNSDNRYTVTIPKLIVKRDGNPAFLYIGGKDKESPYRVITGDQVKNAAHDPFIGKSAIAHYNEGIIEFYNVVPKAVRIVGAFQDPSALEILGVWDYTTDDYPMPAGMIDQLIGKTAEAYIRTLYRTSIQPNTQSDKPVAANARR